MGVREKLNQNTRLGFGIGAGIVVVALLIISLQLMAAKPSLAKQKVAFYTDDNGKTFFTDDVQKVVPFDHNGKQAYLADVFQCADGKQFVGLMYRHTPGGRSEMENYISQNMAAQDKDGLFLQQLAYRGMDVKRAGAGDKAWTRNDQTLNDTIRASVKCGSGGGVATLVIPD